MSIKSFFSNVAKDPAYAFRRLNWELLQIQPEKTVSRRSVVGQMSFSSKDQAIGRAIYLTGQFAFSDVEKVYQYLVQEKYLRPQGNPLLLDIGANIGTICIPMVAKGWFSRAMAFEPDEINRSFLNKNAKQNKLQSQIKVMNFGLSKEDSQTFLNKSKDNFGDHQVVSEATENTVAVRVRQLDKVLLEENIQARDISMIWMDTQGYEGHIIEGAASVLREGIPLVTEFWPHGLKRAGTEPSDFCKTLAGSYNYFIDLQDTEFKKRPTAELLNWAARYPIDVAIYTDFLLIK